MASVEKFEKEKSWLEKFKIKKSYYIKDGKNRTSFSC